MAYLWLLLVVSAGVLCVPPPTEEEQALMSLFSQEEFTRLTSNFKQLSPFTSKRTSFKHKYVSHCGHTLDIQATAAVSNTAHEKAVSIVQKMVQDMPCNIFTTLASRTRVGIFTKSETMSVYPDYASLHDTPECRGTCSGHCSHTCTFDGRKWSTVAGSGGKTASILDDNLLCDNRDPYHHTLNVLVHEFTHTIHGYALDSTWKTKVTQAYAYAKSHSLWPARSYGMANEQEYLAVGATAYFNADHMATGWNHCGNTQSFCPSEYAARTYLYNHDIKLYGILYHIFGKQYSYLTTCV